MRALPLRCTALAGLLAAGCALPIDLPRDYLRLTGTEDFRAVTGDDARVWIRTFTDQQEAPLEFWATAIEHDFTQQRGYELAGKGDVENRAGATGRWFECVAHVRGERVGYLVAVWVAGDDVTVVEFAARAEVFAARVEGVRAALRTVRG